MAKKRSSKKSSKSSPKKRRAKPAMPARKKAAPTRRVSSISSYKPVAHHFAALKPSRSKPIVIGVWALIVSVLASIMLALIVTPYLVLILVAVGFVVGFLNFEHEEPVKFLVAVMGLLVVSTAILLTGFSRLEIVAPVVALYLKRSAYNVIAVVAPAAFVISLKALKELAE